MAKQLKLTIELVPQPLWGINPREAMGRSNWDKVRNQVYAEYGHRCGICNTSGRLEAHEIWEYDDSSLVQRLAGLIALCPLCHQVKHFGRTTIQAAKGIVDMEKIINHFIEVNGCTKEDFNEHYTTMWQLWEDRSARQGWDCDWGPYSQYIKARAPGPP